MTTLSDRPNTALVVIDMQRGVVGDAYDVARVVENINTLVRKARAEQVPVVWVQHARDEPLVHKRYADSFEETDFEARLAERKVGHLVVTGAQTDECIRSTLHGALVRGYDATLVEDAHTTEDMRQWGGPIGPDQAIAYTNLYWKWMKAPGRAGGTVPTAEVDFAANLTRA
jgi:nicotinamidase-related amidase